MNAPRPSAAPASLPLGEHDSENFEGSLQQLISEFFETQDQTSEDAVVDSLERLYVALSHELGRVDGAARLHGVPREYTLSMLRTCMAEGKRVTLSQHEKGCACEASKVLEAEVDAN